MFFTAFAVPRLSAVAVFAALSWLSGCAGVPDPPPPPAGSVSPYEPSAPSVVERMLDLARVGAGDVLWDLGSGDGRIVIAAARRGADAFGVEIIPDLVAQSRETAAATPFPGSATFILGDAFEQDLSAATVVTMYLLPAGTSSLGEKLRGELPPGARVVSHGSPAGDWEPERVVVLPPDASGRPRSLFLWRIPAPAGSSRSVQ